ncbi:MAG: hypothetical protein ABI831_04970 [Betaproteobacteria bacterium]
MQRDIAVAPVSRTTTTFLRVLGIIASGFFVYLYLSSTDGLPADKSRAQLPGLLLMLGLVAGGFAGMWWALHRRSLTLTDSDLIVRAGFYSRTLPRRSLLTGKAEQVSLLDRREFAPRLRTNGIGLPGFRAGWFRLRNNERALVLLTNPFGVTYLPTSEGYALLVSTTTLLAALDVPGTGPT